MSRTERQGFSLPPFLYKENLLTRYCNIVDLGFLRHVNHQLKESSEQQILYQYLNSFSTAQGFKNLITILFYLPASPFDNTSILPQQKLFHCIFLCSAMQDRLVDKWNLERSTLNNWQLMACIAPLKFKKFKNLRNKSKDFSVVSLFYWQQKRVIIKFLSKLVLGEVKISRTYNENEETHINPVVLACIKKPANHLLEFLLRIGVGEWYKDAHLLTEKDIEYQHPLISCFDNNNILAFQFFLTYAQNLLKIYHKYSSSFCLSPPLNYAALKEQALFIEMVAQQKPEYLDQLNTCSGNIAHTALSVFPSYDSLNLRKIVYTLVKYRPALFFVKDITRKTPKDLLPKEFFADPQFQLGF